MSKLEIKKIRKASAPIPIPLKTKQNMGTEGVSEITGIAIPTYLEWVVKNDVSILTELMKCKFEQLHHSNKHYRTEQEENYKNKKQKYEDDEEEEDNCPNGCFILEDDEVVTTTIIDEIIKLPEPDPKTYSLWDIHVNLVSDQITPDQLLYLANCWNAHKTKYLFKYYQIQSYNWISDLQFKQCVDRMKTLGISDQSNFEVFRTVSDRPELLSRTLVGYIDCIDNSTLYEFKCVQNLESEHFLQVALYMYLDESYNENSISLTHSQKKLTKQIVYNFLTNEMCEIYADMETLISIVRTLMRTKFCQPESVPTSVFLKKNMIIYNKYVY